MASPNIYAGGIGGSTGATLATAPRLYASGDVWYVGSATTGAADAASPRGKERIRPLATISQAYTNAAAGDIICLLADHAETLTVSQALAKTGLTVIGEGTGTSRPKFTCNAAISLFTASAAGVWIDNVYFVASTTIAPTNRVAVSAAGVHLTNCYFECGILDTTPSVEFTTGAGQALIGDSQFVSTASSPAAQPASAIKVTNAMSDLTLDTVTIDGGTTGWSNPYAFHGAAAITRLKAVGCMFLNDSDLILATGSSGFIAERDPTGSVRVVWTA